MVNWCIEKSAVLFIVVQCEDHKTPLFMHAGGFVAGRLMFGSFPWGPGYSFFSHETQSIGEDCGL